MKTKPLVDSLLSKYPSIYKCTNSTRSLYSKVYWLDYPYYIDSCFVFSVSLTVTWLVSWWWPCLETWSVLKIWLEVWKCPSCLHHRLIFPGATWINYYQRIRFWIEHKNSTFSDIHCSSTKIFWVPFKYILLCKSIFLRMERSGRFRTMPHVRIQNRLYS